MIRANFTEDDEQTMAHFLNGLNHPIKKIADFQPYSNLIELVHQATKAERQVQDDFKYDKYSSMATASPTPKLQQLQHQLPSLLLAPSTSRVPRKLRPLQVILLLRATSSRELHHHQPPPMKPSRQVPSNASHAEAEATSPTSAPTSGP